MTITQISFVVQLDTEAVQNHLSLAGWIKVLGIDTVKPTWDHVYLELGTVLVGAPHYKRFCGTAQSDVQNWTVFKLYDSVKTQTPARHGFEVEEDKAPPATEEPEPEKVVTPSPTQPSRVITPPPTPAPRKAKA